MRSLSDESRQQHLSPKECAELIHVVNHHVHSSSCFCLTNLNANASQSNTEQIDKPTFLPIFVYFISKNKCLTTRFFSCFFMIQYVQVKLYRLPYKNKTNYRFSMTLFMFLGTRDSCLCFLLIDNDIFRIL